MKDIERSYNALQSVLNAIVDPEFDINTEGNNLDWDGLTETDYKLINKLSKMIKYKINRYYGKSEFIEASGIDEVARYVGESDRAGHAVMSVSEINLDGTHPRVAVTKLKAYKDAVKKKGDESSNSTESANLKGYALKMIERKNGNEMIIETFDSLSEAWGTMIEMNSRLCEGFNGKGYNYGKEFGMKGVMYYVDGSEGFVYDITNLDYEEFVMDYTRMNNLDNRVS